MPVTSDRDVFERFRDSASREISLLAFASYAESKYDWETHCSNVNGSPPTDDEARRWIAELSDMRLNEILRAAVSHFDEAARAYLEDNIQEERQSAIDQSILSEVSEIKTNIVNLTSFKSTFWLNVFVGIVASFFFYIFVLIASLIFFKDPSPFAIIKGLPTNTSSVSGPSDQHTQKSPTPP